MSVVSDRTPTPDAARHAKRLQLRSSLPRRVLKRWNNNDLPSTPRRAEWSQALRRARRVGFLILVVEFIVFCAWSEIEVRRFALSADFAAYLQAAFLFGHGHLSPESTSYFRQLADGAPQSIWGNAGEFYLAPLGVLFRIWPHVVLLKWLQDLALVCAQGVAFAWICDLVAARRDVHASPRADVWLVSLGLLLLIANPWFIWASSFDIHSEPFAAPFVIATARDLYNGRRRAWLWAVCGAGCSAVGATYVVSTSLGMALTSRRRVRSGLSIAVYGVLWLLLLKAVGYLSIVGPGTFATILNGGSGGAYAVTYVVNGTRHYLVGAHGSVTLIGSSAKGPTYGQLLHAIVTHPLNVFKALWVNHANMWGTTSAAGLLGLIWLPVTLPAFAVLIQGGFIRGFSLPSFQNIVVAGLLSVGTIALLIKLSQRLGARRRWLVAVLAGVLAVNTIVWGAVWFPNVTRQWLDVTPQGASALARIQKLVGPNDEVVGSQGIIGEFAARKWVYSLNNLPTTVEVAHGRKVWFILAPYQGIETLDPVDTLAAVKELTRHPGVHELSHLDGIWLFEWSPPRGVKRLSFDVTNAESTPAWALPGVSGRSVQSGSRSQWRVTNTGKPGYVLDQAYWREPAGRYQISVKISTSSPTNVEIWNGTKSILLKRVVLQNTHGVKSIKIRVSLSTTGVQPVINGWGIWSIAPLLRSGYSLELRVYTAGRAGTVNVYSTALRRLGR